MLHKVKSFSENPSEGNLAGVVVDAKDLTDLEMLNIANKVGASETAFIFPSTQADFKLRWFTPNTEVGLCIHATIAALGVMKSLRPFNSDTIRIETKNMTHLCKIRKNNIFVNVPGYKVFSQPSDITQILQLLPIKIDQLCAAPKIVKIFDDYELVIEVRSLNDLKNLAPDQKNYAKICTMLNVTGISIFTRETFDLNNHIHTREFAPLYGYLEDPLCGMAAGAVAQYINEQRILRFEQGHFCNTSGVIIVEPEENRDRFWIGGSYCLLS